jgi:antitoxin YefM
MSIETSYSNVRENLASYMDRAVNDREVIRVKRKGRGDVAIISADELDGLLETAHLLRSPKNAERLFEALHNALAQTGMPVTIEDLEYQFGLNSDSE